MSKRKIAECINIRINVGNYQHIELVKYAEEEIEYTSDADRQQKEDALRDDLISSVKRSMKAIPEKLGKGIENAVEVEQLIKKAIPEWLANGPVPNMANTAKKTEVRVAAEQKEQKDKAESLVNAEAEVKPSAVEVKSGDDDVSDSALFEDTFDVQSNAEASSPVVAVASSTETSEKPKDDLFDDEFFK